MKKQLNSHNFEEVYKKLKIDLNTLGCIMLDVEPIKGIQIKKSWLYYAKNKKRFWIDGFVFNKIAHLTLLYGLLESGKKNKKLVNTVLKGWNIKQVEIKDIGFFNSPYKDENYYCIIGHIKITDKLLEGHRRLEFLPHINTFTGYKPHITLAYIKKDNVIKNSVISMFKNLIGLKLPVKKINYGN